MALLQCARLWLILPPSCPGGSVCLGSPRHMRTVALSCLGLAQQNSQTQDTQGHGSNHGIGITEQ